MKIETNRLLIKTFEKHQLNDVYEIYNDDATCQYLLHDKWTHENKEREFDKKLSSYDESTRFWLFPQLA